MATWFKGLVLAIASILGLSEGGSAPPLTLSAFRDASTLYVSAEMDGLPDRDLERLVEASYTVRFIAASWAGEFRSERYREIKYDGLQYYVYVSETGSTHVTADTQAAWALVSRFGRTPIGSAEPTRFPLAVGCKVSLSLPGTADYDPMIVWGYKPAAGYRELESIGMVPYR